MRGLGLLIVLAACGGEVGADGASDAAAKDASGEPEDSGDLAQDEPDGGSAPDAAAADAAMEMPAPALASQVCSADGFCWEMPSPQGETLNAAWSAAPDDVWAVGHGGVLLHHDGMSFEAAPRVTQQNLLAVHGSGPSDVWAVGEGGEVLHFDGTDWSAQDLSELIDASGGAMSGVLHGVYAAAPDAVWAVGHSGAAALIIHYDGQDWTNQSLSLQSERVLRAVWGVSREHVWAVGDGGVIREYDGTQWIGPRGPSNRDLLSVHGLAEHDVWAVGEEGTAIRWDGRTWTALNSGLSGMLRSVRVDIAAPPPSHEAMPPGNDSPDAGPDAGSDGGPPPAPTGPWSVWAFTDEGKVFRYNGELWAELPSGTDRALHGAARLAGGELLAVGEHGHVLRFAGDARQPLSLGSSKNRLSLWGDGDTLWAVGDEIVRRDGGRWHTMERPTPRSLYAAWGDAETLWTVGTAGTILHYDNGAFSELESQTAGDTWLRGVWGAGDSLWIVGHSGLALVRAAGSFLQVDTPVNRNLLDVWGDADDHFWAVGENGSVLRWDGARWLAVPTGADGGTPNALRAVFGLDREDVWVVGAESTILHWTGQRFEDHSQGERYSLNDVWARSRDEVYAVGTNGVVLRYDGEQWQALDTGTQSSLESVWGDADGRVFVAGLEGTVLMRHD